MKALIFGSYNLDHVYAVDHFVRAGETISVGSYQIFPGGKGLNQAVAFAKCGLDTWAAGAIGAEGGLLLEVLSGVGVHDDYILRKEEPTGHTVIQTAPNGENCILVYGGANQAITRADIDRVLDHFAPGDLLILQHEISGVDYLIRQGHARGLTVILNPSPIREETKALPIGLADYVIVNEIEGAGLSGLETADGQRMIEELAGKYPQSKIVLTLGSEGSLFWDGSRILKQPIYPVKAVDSTGAGDTFTGFFFGSLLSGKPAEEALSIAAKASAIAVSRAGASVSIPTMEEVMERTF